MSVEPAETTGVVRSRGPTVAGGCARRAQAPHLLLMRLVDGHERSEAVRTDVTGHDQEIARWDLWKKPVLVADGDDPHFDVLE
jgi:hypothetical protein